MKPKVWIPAALYYLVILGLSSIPAPQLPDTGVAFADKPAHMAVYTVLGFLLARTGASIPLTLGLGLLASLSDECYQSLIPGRNPDPWDFVADAVGIAFGLLLFRLWQTLRRPNSGSNP